MNIVDWFVVGLVELGEWHKPKHESKAATRLNHDEHELNKATEKQKLWL
jgi:hypothetical protein